MSKAKLGELFFKERALKVSVGSKRVPSIAISERILRNLITGLILLFLMTLATALFLQLSASRDRSIVASTKHTALVLRAAASDLSATLGAGFAGGRTVRALVPEDLAEVLPADTGMRGRLFGRWFRKIWLRFFLRIRVCVADCSGAGSGRSG